MQFERALQALCDAGVDFVIVGGLSATLHGSAQVTYDLDICYSRGSSNLERLVAALEPFHPRPRGFSNDLPIIWDKTALRNTTVLTLQTDLGEIDLLAEVSGLGSYDDVKLQCISVEAFDRRVTTLDLPGLIQSKRAAGRPKDLSHITELESLFEAGDQ